MKIHQILSALAALVAFGQPAPVFAENDPLVLAPSSKWVVHMGSDVCAVVREFGTGPDHVEMRLATVAPDSPYSLTLIGQLAELGDLTSPQQGGDWVDVNFLPGGPQGRGFAGIAATPDAPALVLDRIQRKDTKADATPVSLDGSHEDYSAVDHILLSGTMKRPVSLQTGSLEAVLKVLDQCRWKQVEGWGLDVEANRNRISPPKANAGRMQAIAQQVQAEYPSAALRAHVEAVLKVRLIMDSNGAITACKTLPGMIAEFFGESPCNPFLGKTGIYEPAIGADGKPIASWFIQPIRYVIP